MRRQRQRTVTVEIVEDDPVAAEAVEDQRVAVPVTVQRKVIGAQGVDRDEDHRCVAIDARRRRTVATAIDGRHSEHRCDGRSKTSHPRARGPAQLTFSGFWIGDCSVPQTRCPSLIDLYRSGYYAEWYGVSSLERTLAVPHSPLRGRIGRHEL